MSDSPKTDPRFYLEELYEKMEDLKTDPTMDHYRDQLCLAISKFHENLQKTINSEIERKQTI